MGTTKPKADEHVMKPFCPVGIIASNTLQREAATDVVGPSAWAYVRNTASPGRRKGVGMVSRWAAGCRTSRASTDQAGERSGFRFMELKQARRVQNGSAVCSTAKENLRLYTTVPPAPLSRLFYLRYRQSLAGNLLQEVVEAVGLQWVISESQEFRPFPLLVRHEVGQLLRVCVASGIR